MTNPTNPNTDPTTDPIADPECCNWKSHTYRGDKKIEKMKDNDNVGE